MAHRFSNTRKTREWANALVAVKVPPAVTLRATRNAIVEAQARTLDRIIRPVVREVIRETQAI